MNESSIVALEQAMLARAEALAVQFKDKARQRRDVILRETNDRLSLAEERENASAQAEADRTLRRRVQAGELHLQARLDRLRWELVQGVQARLQERLRQLREDRPAYRAWLMQLLAEGDQHLPQGALHAEVNADDLAWLPAEWEQLVEQAAPGRSIQLSSHPIDGRGGIRLRDAEESVQLDNRFEARLERLQSGIQRQILERLFPSGTAVDEHVGGVG